MKFNWNDILSVFKSVRYLPCCFNCFVSSRWSKFMINFMPQSSLVFFCWSIIRRNVNSKITWTNLMSVTEKSLILSFYLNLCWILRVPCSKWFCLINHIKPLSIPWFMCPQCTNSAKLMLNNKFHFVAHDNLKNFTFVCTVEFGFSNLYLYVHSGS